MDDLNSQIQAFLEKRDSERVSAKLSIKFRQIPKAEADRILLSGDYTDAFAAANLHGDDETVGDAFTENISVSGVKLSGDLRLVGGKALDPGAQLLVEMTVPDAPIPVHSVATIIWSEGDDSNPTIFHAGLIFTGINKQDIMKVARFLVLQRRAKQ